MKLRIRSWGVLLSCVLGALAPALGQDDVTPLTGSTLAERLLAAMGGPEAWSKVAYLHIVARHDDLEISEPFVNEIWNDFSRPRVRFSARNDGFESRSWIADGVGGRLSASGASTPFSPAEYESDRGWWEANVYRTIHRIARRDPALRYRSVGTTRLEVLKQDGTILNWFVLNLRGEPMLFGAFGDEGGTAFGPLAAVGKVKYPKWGVRTDGSWRYEIERFEPAPDVPVDAFPGA